ncbi:30S ribosomal protein S1 [Alphaproteobacteria bacterium]|nr:30S ribosomal protein S1 [Alphaproteobacteria bacterium]
MTNKKNENFKNNENLKNNESNNLPQNYSAEEDFAKLLEEYEKDSQQLVEGSVVKGVVVGISDKGVAVDIGAKSVGFVDIMEFKRDGEVEEGDVVDVFLERLENKKGELIISRDNARRFNNWHFLKQCLEDKTIVEGKIIGRVKGGYAVDINAIICFLPRSQVDTMLLSDDSFLINKIEKLMVLKIDEVRGNIVVSRRAVLETQRNVEKEKVLSTIKVGDAIDGVVKNITDYGAFIDFGSFDGLLHLTDISWCRIKHPSEMLKIGQEVKVQVIKYDEATKRVSLGMKQLQQNPWESIAQRYVVGSTLKGKVTNITSYGAFVEIEQGIEGLVHVSEMSWLKNNSSPNKFINVGQEVEVMVLDVNSQNHRISLGMKQCEQNPWQSFSEKNKVGDVVQGVVKNFTEFGLFIGFDSGVDGLVHVSDISNDGINDEIQKKYKSGEKIKVMVLGSNYEKERISLGIRQLDNPNFQAELDKVAEGTVVSCLVIGVKKDFLEVELDSGLKAIIKRLDLSKNKNEQKTEKFEVGDRIEAKVTMFNKISGKLLLSIKDMEIEEQEAHIYSESSSGTTIGNIAGDVLESLKKQES